MDHNILRNNKKTALSKYISRALCLTLALIMTLSVFAAIPAEAAKPNNLTVDVGIPVEEHPELFFPRSLPTKGEAKVAVFLIEFPDAKNENPDIDLEYYEKIYFKGGKFKSTIWEEKTVAEYYYEQSYGKLSMDITVFDWYTAKHERSYYDEKKPELMMEAAAYYESLGADFSKFDENGDGIFDTVAFHFGGEASASMEDPWYGGVNYGIDGDRYFGEIGSLKLKNIVQMSNADDAKSDFIRKKICHELMHSLGMPDLYGEVNVGMDPANDLMSTGTLTTINPYTKILLGWIDTVDVITTDTENIKLLPYNTDPEGKAVIVTNNFEGLFDEFYIVAYRDYSGMNSVIWKIDARLNENGDSFMNANLYYDPRPDKKHEHSSNNASPYLFIEEVSADPLYEKVINGYGQPYDTAFTEGSVLGPNTRPSSDRHDGDYTGIKIDNFKEHNNEEYLTFDVTFVEDNIPPQIITTADELGFPNDIKIEFNEYIYEGTNFDSLKVTDLEGEPLDVSYLIPHYPLDLIEITFKNEAYQNGYIIELPAGCIRDSSGNPSAPLTLTVVADKTLYPPISEEQLPSLGNKYTRNNLKASFFRDGDTIVVLTVLWEHKSDDESEIDAKIEFMRLDLEGNVLKQTIVDNPFDGSTIITDYTKTADGSYLVLCYYVTNYENIFFCIDKNGELKWTNDEYNGSDRKFSVTTLALDEGVILEAATTYEEENVRQFLIIDNETGEIREPKVDSTFFKRKCFDLGDRTMLCNLANYSDNNGSYLKIARVDSKTLEIICENTISYEREGVKDSLVIMDAHINDDGSFFLFCRQDTDIVIVLLDPLLNTIKTIKYKTPSYLRARVCWLDNGFAFVYCSEPGNHTNNLFKVYRYDKLMTHIWTGDIYANFLYFFNSPTGDLLAYRSMLKPIRECYIDHYENDTSMIPEHIHSTVRIEAKEATCTENGSIECWRCEDCGQYFYDENCAEPVSDLATLSTPAAHKEITNPGIAPTCTKPGFTEEKICSRCNEVLVPHTKIPPSHTFGEWVIKTKPQCDNNGLQVQICTVCGTTRDEILPSLGSDHSFGEWEIVLEATCEAMGEKVRTCSTCDKEERELIPPLEDGHSFGEWEIKKAPTCNKAGSAERTCSVCRKTEQDNLMPIPDAHTFGEWENGGLDPETNMTEEQRVCDGCKIVERRYVPAQTENETETAARETAPSIPQPPTEESGCLGSLSASALPIITLLSLAAAFATKKKDHR